MEINLVGTLEIMTRDNLVKRLELIESKPLPNKFLLFYFNQRILLNHVEETLYLVNQSMLKDIDLGNSLGLI